MLAEAPQIHVNDELSADARVRVDSPQIQQVILNLLKNSLDAMQAMPTEQQRIDITLTQQDADIIVQIRDYGPGLAPHEFDRLFEPFYTNKPDGLGLGLSISYSIVEAHGGTLAAYAPDAGTGMVFSLSLPAVRRSGTVLTQDHS